MSLNFGYLPPGLRRIKKDIKMNGHKILNLPSPTSDSEPVTRSYADTYYSSGGAGQRGPKGDKGDIGLMGPKGDKGDIGLTGPKGDKGNIGLTGPKGDKGDIDLTGPKGDKGDIGPAGSGGVSASGFTMQGNIDMNNTKIINISDPTLANDPITKQYANRVYLTHSGFIMQDNIGMNNHEVLGLNPNPSNGTAAVSKDFTDSQYVKKDSFIDMNDNRILNLPFPQTSGEPVTKEFVDKYYVDYINILTFKGSPGKVTILRKNYIVDLPTVDFSKVGDSYQIAFSVNPKLPNGIYTYEMNVVLTTSRGYNITLWGDCGGSG